MILIDGKGKIGKDGKYIVSPHDRKISKRLIEVLFAQAQKILTNKFGSVIFLEGNEKPEYNKIIEQAGGCLFTPSIAINSPNFITNRQAFIHVDTGINVNGYNNKEFKRHYVISFELKGMVRYKYQKHWENDCTIIKKYVLADSLIDALAEFELWLTNEYDKFFVGRAKQNLPYSR